MRRFLTVLLWVALLALPAVSAQASLWTLDYMDHLFGYGSTTLRWDANHNGSFGDAIANGEHNETFGVGGVGRMDVRYYPQGQPSQWKQSYNFFCVDLMSYLDGGTWNTERYTVPPDSPSPPPYNLRDAAWIYYREKANWKINADYAAATQLALWEITHETSWRTNYDSNWWDTGYFRNSISGNVRTYATNMLSELKGIPEPVTTESIYFYRPLNIPGSQGLLTEVPEPTSVILLGAVLLGAAGIGAARRRK